MKTLLLDILRVDYVTVTYYPRSGDDTYEQLLGIARKLGASKRARDARRLQYIGELIQGEGGTCFLGAGEQRDKAHVMMQVSGAWAHDAWTSGLRRLAVTGWVKLTRLDIQVTKYKPVSIYLGELYKQATSTHNTLGFVESCSEGERLATLYFGNRASERFWRIYEKLSATGEILLRAELELKGTVANQLPSRLPDITLGQVYNNYLAKLPWAEIRDLFRNTGEKEGVFVPVRSDTNTEQWLLDTVAPALTKFLSTDPEPSQVASAFEAVLERYHRHQYSESPKRGAQVDNPVASW